jgi:hypothetical protein
MAIFNADNYNRLYSNSIKNAVNSVKYEYTNKIDRIDKNVSEINKSISILSEKMDNDDIIKTKLNIMNQCLQNINKEDKYINDKIDNLSLKVDNIINIGYVAIILLVLNLLINIFV